MIHSYDIGVALGNGGDNVNVIEACRKLKGKELETEGFIGFFSLKKGNLLILKVEKQL